MNVWMIECTDNSIGASEWRKEQIIKEMGQWTRKWVGDKQYPCELQSIHYCIWPLRSSCQYTNTKITSCLLQSRICFTSPSWSIVDFDAETRPHPTDYIWGYTNPKPPDRQQGNAQQGRTHFEIWDTLQACFSCCTNANAGILAMHSICVWLHEMPFWCMKQAWPQSEKFLLWSQARLMHHSIEISKFSDLIQLF